MISDQLTPIWTLNANTCKVYDPADDSIKDDCLTFPNGKGICKFKLGKSSCLHKNRTLNVLKNSFTAKAQGYEKIEELDYKLHTTSKADVPTDFGGNGLIHVELLEEPTEKLLEIVLPYTIMLSEILLEMPKDKSFTTANISVVEQEVQYPNIWKQVWVGNKHHVFYSNPLSIPIL